MINFHPMVKKTGVNTEELGSAVRRRREQQNLSLRDVADQTGERGAQGGLLVNGATGHHSSVNRDAAFYPAVRYP